jgi:hypothetical protein
LQQTRPLVIKTRYQQQQQAENRTDLEDRAVQLLKSQINSIVKSLQKLLKNKNAKTRQGCFSLLTELVTVLPGGLSNYLAQVIPGINYSLKYKKRNIIQFCNNNNNLFNFFFNTATRLQLQT